MANNSKKSGAEKAPAKQQPKAADKAASGSKSETKGLDLPNGLSHKKFSKFQK